LIDRINGTASVWWYEYWHFRVLRALLRRKLASGSAAVVYAQCPLSARAALETRTSSDQQVVMAVHFNVSQADEWVTKGKIPRDGGLFRGIRQRELEILPKLDGMVFVSDFARREVYQRIPEAKRVPSVMLFSFIKKTEKTDPTSPRNDLINIGTLEPRKNQQYLLEVLAETKKRGREFRLSLVGEGPDRSKLERLAARLGIAQQVTFVGRHPQAVQLLPFHRVYCHSAQVETLGSALIEAMSCGLPILAAPVGGIPEVFTDGAEGRYWPLDNAGKAAEILIEVMENKDLYQKMSQASRARFTRQFDASVIGRRLMNFLYDRDVHDG
jgi:glycosyltransferase involved in cell wall biosynthesis